MKKIDFSEVTIKQWIRFAIDALVFILLIIWVGNYWLLLGLPIVFDIYITKIIPWSAWKKRKDGKKPSAVFDWIYSIIYALVAVYFINLFLFQNYKIPTSSLEKSLLVGDHLFVSKVSYGPRMPNAPLAMPLTQNTLPFSNCRSYFEWPLWGYKRLAGLGNVERNDIVVFNFPAGDTVCFNRPNPDYYSILLEEGIHYLSEHKELIPQQQFATSWERNHFITKYGRERVWANEKLYDGIVWRPVDKRDCYVKRCLGLPGDTIEIRHNEVFIDGKHLDDAPDVQHLYNIVTNGVVLNDKFFENFSISNEDRNLGGTGTYYRLPLSAAKARQVEQMSIISSIKIEEDAPDSTGFSVFPYSQDYPWSRDNFGPLWIPKRGATVALDSKNIMLYERIITSYEGHTLDYRNGKIYIDGAETTEYTFAMDYYWMMGDNRHKSADSRYWGFVPEDHIVGKPLFVWLSLDADKSGFSSIRWNRFFTWVK
ncbi:MAG: S26 family signal peptidase [Bacteroidales bacterium]|nr:S26 family signal peptidase [Bacteroidales bacterium]